MANAMSSSLNAVRVLPVPETARNSTCPATLMKYEELIIISAGTDAVTRSGMSVYMRATVSGNRQKSRISALTAPYESLRIRLISDMTLS